MPMAQRIGHALVCGKATAGAADDEASPQAVWQPTEDLQLSAMLHAPQEASLWGYTARKSIGRMLLEVQQAESLCAPCTVEFYLAYFEYIPLTSIHDRCIYAFPVVPGHSRQFVYGYACVQVEVGRRAQVDGAAMEVASVTGGAVDEGSEEEQIQCAMPASAASSDILEEDLKDTASAAPLTEEQPAAGSDHHRIDRMPAGRDSSASTPPSSYVGKSASPAASRGHDQAGRLLGSSKEQLSAADAATTPTMHVQLAVAAGPSSLVIAQVMLPKGSPQDSGSSSTSRGDLDLGAALAAAAEASAMVRSMQSLLPCLGHSDQAQRPSATLLQKFLRYQFLHKHNA